MTSHSENHRTARLLDDAKGAPDARDTVAAEPNRWSGIVRCTFCGREVQDDWTPEDGADRLCARCRWMVDDPDGRR